MFYEGPIKDNEFESGKNLAKQIRESNASTDAPNEKTLFYSRTSIFVFSVFLTGVVGALMLGYNLKKAGKNRFVFPLVLVSLLTNVLLYLIMKTFLQTASMAMESDIKVTAGWEHGISNDSLWWIGDQSFSWSKYYYWFKCFFCWKSL